MVVTVVVVRAAVAFGQGCGYAVPHRRMLVHRHRTDRGARQPTSRRVILIARASACGQVALEQQHPEDEREDPAEGSLHLDEGATTSECRPEEAGRALILYSHLEVGSRDIVSRASGFS